MARKPRQHVPGGVYHVIQRGNDRQPLFFENRDRIRFYELLAEGTERFGYRVLAFCLMTNHVHLVVRVGDETLSRGLHNLGFRYARNVNRSRGRSGHLFQGRFKAYLVLDDSYLLALVRYLHLNPVHARLVADPARYRWSSHRAYLGREKLSWLACHEVLAMFADTGTDARIRYRGFIQEGLEEGGDATTPEIAVQLPEPWGERHSDTDARPPPGVELGRGRESSDSRAAQP